MNRLLLYCIICGIILLFFIFFFPIKFAVSEDELDLINDPDYYIIEATDATGGFWFGYNKNEKEVYFLNLKGNSFENILGCSILGSFNTVRIKNKFIIYGEKYKVLEPFSYDINIVKWDIVAPIKRDSIYGFIANKNYLTLWDYINKKLDFLFED